MNTPQTISGAPARRPHSTIRPASGWAALDLAQVWQFRDLLTTLAGRDIKLRYRQTVLGALWVVIQPLLSAGILSFVFNRVANLPTGSVPPFLFSYVGSIAFYTFSSTLGKSSTCLLQNSGLISKIYFPRLVLPISTVFSTLLDFAVSLVVLLALMVFYRIAPTPAILLLPVWIGLILMLALGLGLFAAALTVSYRDVQYILPVVTQMLTFASPVGYSLAVALERVEKVSPALRAFYLFNPLSSLLEGFRWSVLGTSAPPVNGVIFAAVFSVGVLFAGAFAFKNMERRFADVI